jgi:hypothetical protein
VVCLAAKPAVDGLQREMEGSAIVLRANIQSDAGSRLSQRYGVHVVPGFVVLAPSGRVVLRLEGTRGAPIPDLRRAIMDASRSPPVRRGYGGVAQRPGGPGRVSAIPHVHRS